MCTVIKEDACNVFGYNPCGPHGKCIANGLLDYKCECIPGNLKT